MLDEWLSSLRIFTHRWSSQISACLPFELYSPYKVPLSVVVFPLNCTHRRKFPYQWFSSLWIVLTEESSLIMQWLSSLWIILTEESSPISGCLPLELYFSSHWIVLTVESSPISGCLPFELYSPRKFPYQCFSSLWIILTVESSGCFPFELYSPKKVPLSVVVFPLNCTHRRKFPYQWFSGIRQCRYTSSFQGICRLALEVPK